MSTIPKWGLCLLLFLFLSCNKDEKYQTSYWVVNTDSFSTNDYSIGIGKTRAGFSSTDFNNRFALGFFLSFLPTSGEWLIRANSGQNPNYAGISFRYNGVFYIVSPNQEAYLIATEKNKKASYRLEPTWYVNYYNHNDSVLISGTFNEP